MAQPTPTGNDDPVRRRALMRSLRIVLVFTFIGSGLMLINNLMMGLSLPMLNELNDAGSFDKLLPEIYTTAFEMALAMPQAYYLICAVLNALSFLGALMMWEPRKNGFHFYTMSQLLIIVTGIVFLGRQGVQVGDIMLTALFVFYYYVTLRSLGLFASKKAEEDDEEDEEDDEDEDEDSEDEETSENDDDEVSESDEDTSESDDEDDTDGENGEDEKSKPHA